MYGYSMGTCPSITIAGDTSAVIFPVRLITEAPFASVDVMASDASALDMPGSYYSSDRDSEYDRTSMSYSEDGI